MAFKMKGFSPFTKEKHYHQKKDVNVGSENIEKYPTRPLKEGEGEPKGGIAPIPGGSSKIFKAFEKIAKSRALQNKKLQELLEKSGKTFVKKKK